jgi:hypothetical protein
MLKVSINGYLDVANEKDKSVSKWILLFLSDVKCTLEGEVVFNVLEVIAYIL